MNFFGHASIACRFSTEPHFVLGAMIPDLRAMAGIGRSDWQDPRIAAGIVLHHATDALYHDHPLVRSRMAEEAGRLRDLGLASRLAQAVAHVGVELVTDGKLAHCLDDVQAFEAAVRRAVDPQGPIASNLEGDDERELWQRVAARLSSGDFPLRYREPEFVATRIEIVFRRRPRLTFGPELVPVLSGWIASLSKLLDPEIDLVIGDLLQGLSGHSGEAS